MTGTSVMERSASRMNDSDSSLGLAPWFDLCLPASRPTLALFAVRNWTVGAILAVTLAAALGLSGAASAEPISGTILGSGINANLSTTFQRDSNWKIVAVPVGYTPPDSQAVPYNAYVPQTVAASWLGSGGGSPNPQTGYTTGGTTYHWIAPDPNVTALSTVLTPVTTTEPTSWYKWIAAQTFTIPADDNYFLNFPSAVDNRLDYFVNGSIDVTNPRQPTITGGFQITTTNTSTGQFLAISNNTNATPIFLAAGTHTAYMVLTDLGNATGVLIGPSEFSTVPVPEPTSLTLASAGAGVITLVLRRKHIRRN